jgi:uncharacterized membrane protein
MSRTSLSRPFFLLGVLPGWCVLLLAIRFVRVGHFGYLFLGWNLLLAMIPAAAALMLARADSRGASVLVRLAWFVLWLLFLPNAPYLMTDLVHLGSRPPMPFWYDIALVLSFACTGLFLAFGSAADVHEAIARRWNAPAGWAVALVAMVLSGAGIYMGRFMRWNSWDAITHPRAIADHAANALAAPLQHPAGLHVTLVYGFGLALGYAAARFVVPTPPARGENR